MLLIEPVETAEIEIAAIDHIDRTGFESPVVLDIDVVNLGVG
jgi:hypothetical protein